MPATDNFKYQTFYIEIHVKITEHSNEAFFFMQLHVFVWHDSVSSRNRSIIRNSDTHFARILLPHICAKTRLFCPFLDNA